MKYKLEFEFHVLDYLNTDKKILDRLNYLFGEENVEISVNGTGFGNSVYIVETEHDLKHYDIKAVETIGKEIIKINGYKI